MKLKIELTKPGNLPYVRLYHGVELYNFLIDTGSTDCWLLPACIYQFMRDGETSTKQRLDNMDEHFVFTATLRVEPVTGEPKDDLMPKFRTEFMCKTLENFTEMNKVLGDKIHGILGMSFFRDNHVKLDLDRLIMQL